MYVKIYFDSKPLFLCDAIDETIRPYVQHDDAVYVDELNAHTVKTMIYEMQQPQVHAGIFLHGNLEQLTKAVQKKFTIVRAAGGLVMNEDNLVLLIFRRGRWDLPKGKVNKGETIEHCARREVEEETGLNDVELISPLTITYHTYHEGTKYILKESHWFLMRVNGVQEPVPQTEEEITDSRWVKQDEIWRYLKETFPLILDVTRSARDKGFISF